MSSPRARAALAVVLSASVLPLGAAVPAAAAPVAADQQVCDPAVVPESEPTKEATPKVNPAHERMNVAAAHELARGRGMKVAVIDSGVVAGPGMRVLPLPTTAGASGVIKSGHGTIVAGLIAGKRGVAPEATIYDVKVFDADEIEATEGKSLSSAGIVAGIRAVLGQWERHRFDVVNISLAVGQDDPELAAAVAELVARDTVVVASAGNAAEPVEGFPGTPGSDDTVFPADYPGVLGVSAVPLGDQDPAGYVTPNRDTDVAAPTEGAVSVNATAQQCVVNGVATSWAAAEVSGIVALLRQRFPDDTPQQIVARLEATAEGAGAQPEGAKAANPWTGSGVVQAHDALTRQVRPDRTGALAVSEPQIGADAQAPPPPPDVDLFGSSRALLLWTGLLAGALLALAFMLRPLIRPLLRR